MSNNSIQHHYHTVKNSFRWHHQDFHSQITCRQCETLFYPPIFLCINGHSLCQKCIPNFAQCVECCGQLTSRRNIAAEALYDQLRVPCKNRDVGCQFEALGVRMRRHNDVCQLAFKFCPVRGCCWRGNITTITKHFLDAHTFRKSGKGTDI